ncbi:unnamed protein product [Bodo saltans]|uniref:Uncharacterized protein n=1 Tax=Bodo saltans TaxID=75058 RepID=A0A0S4J716_BODSA|nr:unnamed protein product [Bodo saltans]|eukprot:CUG86224.1 unnamed protein product [Bodo saltans]
MDASVGLPLVEPLAIPSSLSQAFPFLIAARPSSFCARLYACIPAVVMTSSPVANITSTSAAASSSAASPVATPRGSQRDNTAANPEAVSGDVRPTDEAPSETMLRVDPRDVLIGVSYTSVFVCDLLSSSICGVFPFGKSLSSMYSSTGSGTRSPSPQLQALVTAQDDASWVVLQYRASSESDKDIGGAGLREVLFQIPALGQRTKFINAVTRLFQHHAKSSVTSSLDDKIVPQASELRTAWETSQREQWKKSFSKKGSHASNDTTTHSILGFDIPSSLKSNRVARQLLVPLQARWVLNRRGVPLVVDRMKQARDEYQHVEEATNATLAEIERDFDRIFGLLDSRFANLSVEDNVLSQWDRELEEKESRRMVAEAELRRARDAARQIALEKERAIVRCTEELQSWRKILSEKQHEELQEREALMTEERRILLARQDGLRVLEELKRELELVEAERAEYEAADYVALVEERDATLQEVKEAQLALSTFEAEVVPSIKKRLADSQKKIANVTMTNKALRKLLHKTESEISSFDVEDNELNGDQQLAANDVVALEDALLLVDLEYARARQERDVVKDACLAAGARTAALVTQANQGSGAERLGDATARYRVAKLRMARARKEQQGAELLANRAASVHRSGTCELQQQILFEAIRLKSPSSTTAAPTYMSSNSGTTFSGVDFGDEELDSMLQELLS